MTERMIEFVLAVAALLITYLVILLSLELYFSDFPVAVHNFFVKKVRSRHFPNHFHKFHQGFFDYSASETDEFEAFRRALARYSLMLEEQLRREEIKNIPGPGAAVDGKPAQKGD
jgi:hypothetical protein